MTTDQYSCGAMLVGLGETCANLGDHWARLTIFRDGHTAVVDLWLCADHYAQVSGRAT